MIIAKKLGLESEIFCRMVVTTKMLFSNVLGHAAELHYEKYLKDKGIKFHKVHTDKHYDYIVENKKDQVKRFETNSTNDDYVGVNLTQTHGDRSGKDAFYTTNAFDRLILFDVGFGKPIIIKSSNIPKNSKYPTHLIGKHKWSRSISYDLDEFEKEFLKTMKFKSGNFPAAMEKLREKYKLNYRQLLEKCCSLSLEEIDSLFGEDNFRLITGAKGFTAEEHFNVFLEKNKIPYEQEKAIYSKVDHWVKETIRVQVKIPNQRAVNHYFWGFKTHKSHGHGVGELYKVDMFDIIALFIGFHIDETKSKYLPVSVEEKFLFIPIKDLEQHPKHPGYLKRISKIRKDKYKVNDLSIFNKI